MGGGPLRCHVWMGRGEVSAQGGGSWGCLGAFPGDLAVGQRSGAEDVGGPPSLAQAGLPDRMRELQRPSPSGHRPSQICIHLLTSWLPADGEVAKGPVGP